MSTRRTLVPTSLLRGATATCLLALGVAGCEPREADARVVGVLPACDDRAAPDLRQSIRLDRQSLVASARVLYRPYQE